MKSLIIWVSLFVMAACRAGLAAELPVNLSGAKLPDYEAILKIQDQYSKSGPRLQSILHKNGWSKTQQTGDFSPSTYFGDKDVQLNVFGPLNGEPDGMSIQKMDGPSRDYMRIRDSRPTDQYDLQAGEKCRFFTFRRRPRQEIGSLEYLSCVTADGIEIAERTLSSRSEPISTTSLVKLIRRPLKSDEVLPKDEWFQARYWLEPMPEMTAAEKRAHPDFVATLEASFGRIMLWRRHYPWNYQDIRGLNGRRTVKIWNELESRGLHFGAREGGQFEYLSVTKNGKSLLSFGSFGFGKVPEPMGKTDVVLGETCNWFNMAPGMFDMLHHECRTADDVVMKMIDERSRFTAISVMKRPVAMEELLPEKAIFDPENWGINTVRD